MSATEERARATTPFAVMVVALGAWGPICVVVCAQVGLHACRVAGVKVRGAKEVCVHQLLQAFCMCAAYIEHMHMRVRRQRRSRTYIFFANVLSINDHSTCNATQCPWIPRKACTADKCVLCCIPSFGRKESNVVICSFPSVVSTVCGIQNCYHCGY